MKKILILFLFIFSCFYTITTQAKELKFAQISDVHLSISENKERKFTENEEQLRKAIKQINKDRKIDFVLFTGDNINKATKKNMARFLRTANKLNKPYYVVIGNHDVFRYNRFDKEDYIHSIWLRHPQMLFKKTNYTFKPNRELVFLVVDGANELIPSQSGYYKPETLEWVNKQLKKYKNKKVVIVQHFPLIPPKAKRSHYTLEPEKYFHIINSYDNVIAILSGHFHHNNTIYKRGIYHMSAPAFSKRPHEYKVITIQYKPKYLFSNPSEFKITQEIIPMMNEVDILEAELKDIEYQEKARKEAEEKQEEEKETSKEIQNTEDSTTEFTETEQDETSVFEEDNSDPFAGQLF